jgi:hypothetical protein
MSHQPYFALPYFALPQMNSKRIQSRHNLSRYGPYWTSAPPIVQCRVSPDKPTVNVLSIGLSPPKSGICLL